jgi:hypothetical protein
LRVARRRRAERFYACGALQRFRAARSTWTLGVTVSRAAAVTVAAVTLSCAVVAHAHILEFPFSSDCDAASGRYEEWHHSELGTPGILVTGKIEFIEPRHHIKRFPFAGVVFIGETNQIATGLEMYMHRADSTVLHVAVLDESKPGGIDKFASYSWKKTPIVADFTLKLTSSGELTVSVDGRFAKPRVIDFAPKSLFLGCSNAKVRFTDVKLKSTGDT